MKTSGLEGHSLNVAVHKALNVGTSWRYYGQTVPNYCNEWKEGGPIIEREKIEICHWFSDQQWHAANNTKLAYDDCGEFITGSDFLATGTTPLIAAMRCYVASKLGDEVTVSKEPV